MTCIEIPEEIWEQDTTGPLGPAALAPEGLGREEPGRTTLPHNFRCAKGHWHSVAHVRELLGPNTPICLLQRIILEWA